MSKKYNYTGVVIEVGKVQTFNNFKKRELVVCDEPDAKYPNFVPFEATGDKCKELDAFKAGDEVEVGFFVNGRKWEKDGKTRYFTSLRIADVARAGEKVKAQDEPTEPEEISEGDVDDIPF